MYVKEVDEENQRLERMRDEGRLPALLVLILAVTKKPPMPTGRTEARERAGVSQRRTCRRRERGGGTHCRGRRGTSRWWRLRDLGQPWLLCRRREGRGREERTHGGFGAALSL